jgi:PAP2 superfamily
MAAALALGLALTGFSIQPASMLVPLGAAAIYVGAAYYNACVPHRRDPMVVFVLGSTAQLVLITLIMTPMTYMVAAAGLPMADASLDYLDRALGLDWRGYFSFVYARPQLITGLVLGYGMIGWPIFGIPVALGMTRHYRRLQEFTLAFALALIATTVISMFVPALGAYDQLGIKPDPAVFTPGGYLDTVRDLPLVRGGSLRELDIGKLVGIITFPSFHAAAAVLYLWALWSVWWLRPLALIANGGMLLATPIGGGHYFVDVIAGIAVAVLAIIAALRVGERLAEPAAQPLLAGGAPAATLAAPDAAEIAQ